MTPRSRRNRSVCSPISSVGIGVVVIAEYFLRRIRGRTLAYLGARWDVMTAARALETVLGLPLAFTESGHRQLPDNATSAIRKLARHILGPNGDRTARCSIHRRLRRCNRGYRRPSRLGAAASGSLVLRRRGGSVPEMRRRYAMTGDNRQKLLRLLMETVTKHRAIKESGAEEAWYDRSRTRRRTFGAPSLPFRATQSVREQHDAVAGRHRGHRHIVRRTSHGVGGDLSVGALIATMAVVWRFMSPVQAASPSQSIPSGFQRRQAGRPVFRLSLSANRACLSPLFRNFQGNLTINRLSFRYSPVADPP